MIATSTSTLSSIPSIFAILFRSTSILSIPVGVICPTAYRIMSFSTYATRGSFSRALSLPADTPLTENPLNAFSYTCWGVKAWKFATFLGVNPSLSITMYLPSEGSRTAAKTGDTRETVSKTITEKTINIFLVRINLTFS